MTQELLEKLYNNPDELEKMAQEQQAVNDALEYLHKCAEEGGIDISQLSPEQQLELYNALVSEIQGEGQAEVAQEQPVDPAAVAQPEQPAMQPAVAAPEMGGMTAEQQQKVAETMYFSEMFGKNAAHTYWKELQTLSKEAAEHCEPEKEEKKEHKGSPTFEAMAIAKAKKMKEEHSKTAAFEALLQHRAEELLASGQV
jgi:hypothetical protein